MRLSKFHLKQKGLSGVFYVGDPLNLFAEDDSWKNFTSTIGAGQGIIKWKGYPLFLARLNQDGWHLVYEQTSEHCFDRVDQLAVDTGLLVVAPVEAADADQQSVEDGGMILQGPGGIDCEVEYAGSEIYSLTVGGHYIPIDWDQQRKLKDASDLAEAEELERARKSQMAKALEKRNRKEKKSRQDTSDAN